MFFVLLGEIARVSTPPLFKKIWLIDDFFPEKSLPLAWTQPFIPIYLGEFREWSLLTVTAATTSSNGFLTAVLL